MRLGRSQRYDQARPLAVLGMGVAAWLVAPLAVRTMIRAGFVEMTAPVPMAASHLRDLEMYWSLKMHSRDDLISAGVELARERAFESASLQENADLRAQVGRLETLLTMPPVPQYRYEHARIVLRDTSAWWQRMVIRKGADYNIAVGAPVIFSGGVVGRVTEVHAHTSVVELITSPALRIAAHAEGDEHPVSYEGGDNPTFGPPRGIVEYVPIDVTTTASNPRRLLTDGRGGVFPPGLVIGIITRLELSSDGLFKTGSVQLDPRLEELDEVSVLAPL